MSDVLRQLLDVAGDDTTDVFTGVHNGPPGKRAYGGLLASQSLAATCRTVRPDLAPKHVERVKKLAKEGFYNGLKFHRVINGFMAQTGDPTGTGMSGSKYGNLPAEFTKEPFVRGSVGAARSQSPDSANSQFFICFNDSGCSSLTGQYTVWGKVIDGMTNVDQIVRGEPPAKPDVMQKVYLLSDQK